MHFEHIEKKKIRIANHNSAKSEVIGLWIVPKISNNGTNIDISQLLCQDKRTQLFSDLIIESQKKLFSGEEEETNIFG